MLPKVRIWNGSPWPGARIRALRAILEDELGSTEIFARAIDVDATDLRAWEQGMGSPPEETARRLDALASTHEVIVLVARGYSTSAGT